ncbi:MAG TPA: ABC transporter ATP-binding protein [Candidatus Pygmaiobacter gallistercoris]|nr:ABC transporter ATP-binding protein [Candidatus Pygmaiobacter gallistercoris]
MKPMIETVDLEKVYHTGHTRVFALRGINLTLAKGEFCCIVGASGSGKSTLLHQLAGLEKPTRGSVTVAGERISEMTEARLAVFRQRRMGFVFQSYNLLPTLTALENVALPLMFRGVPRRQREALARAQLIRLGLEKRLWHRPSALSGGQQQRVGIARAFVGKPAVVFADEPTGNLDSRTTAQVMNVILRLVRENRITFVMVTHERELASCADRILTLRDGRIIEDERVNHPAKGYPLPET